MKLKDISGKEQTPLFKSKNYIVGCSATVWHQPGQSRDQYKNKATQVVMKFRHTFLILGQ